MNFSNVDPAVVAAIGFAVAGVTELVKRLFDRDFRAATIIATSAVVGALVAPQAGPNITWFVGGLIGLSASGVITTLSYIKA